MLYEKFFENPPETIMTHFPPSDKMIQAAFAQAEFMDSLTEEQKKLFDAFWEIRKEINRDWAFQLFLSGFRAGEKK